MALSAKRFIQIISFMLMGGFLFADESALVIDVDTALELALGNNLQVKSALMTNENRLLARSSAWNEFVPQISIGLGLSHLNEEQAAYPMMPVPSQWNLQAQISMSLTLSIRNYYSIQKTILDYEAGLTSLAKAKSSLTRLVKKQFFSLLLLQEQLKVATITLQNSQARYRQARIDYEHGIITEYDLLRSQVYFENNKPVVSDLTNSYTNQEQLLKYTLGIGIARPIVLKGSLNIETRTLNADELVGKYLIERFDMREAREAIASLKNNLDLTCSVMYPSLTLSFLYDPTINGPFEKDLFSGDNWIQRTGAFSISIRQLIDPLLPMSKTRVSADALNTQITLAEENLKQVAINGEMQIRKNVRAIEISGTSIRTKEFNRKVAERAFSLAQESYDAGGLDLLELKDAEKDLEQARLTLLSEKFNYLGLLTDLEYEMNTSLNNKETSNEKQ